MTITSAMNAGVSGLNANAARLGAISDNIANSSTYGYKRVTTEFASMVMAEGGSGSYAAGGVRASSSRLIDEKGGLVSTSNALDLALTGRGMLPVTTQASAESGQNSLMLTRGGAFRLDETGTLRTDGGLVLMGWPAADDGTIPLNARNSSSGLEPIVINSSVPVGNPTSKISLGINLPSVETSAGASGSALPVGIEYFGNLGRSETLNVSFIPSVPSSGDSNKWTMLIQDSASNNATVGEYTLTFDGTRATGGSLLSVTNASGGAYNTATGMIEVQVAGGPMQISLGKLGESTGLTQLAGPFAPVAIVKDGSPVGTVSGIDIDEKGNVIARYDSGFTRVLYQVPLVDVPNPNGLTAVNNQAYEISQDSGAFYLWDAGSGPTGTLSGYSRESSTTDVAAELTALIQTQRAYSSSAKVITTVDEMLQETTNIKR